MTTILISAGDLSGERLGAELVRAVRERIPDARFVGMGGAAMAAAGVEIVVDQRALAVGGLVELVGSMPRLVGAWRRMASCLRATDPDLIVLIDSGGFNLPFARRARQRSRAKILYYVAPQVWAWRPGRFRRVVACADRIAVILPFEADFYASRGVQVDFVGHPALDRVDTTGRSLDPAAARLALGLETAGPILGMLPGSRRNELRRHLPIQLDALLELRAHVPGLRLLQGLVGVAPNLDLEEARAIVHARATPAEHAIHVVHDVDGRTLEACDVALVKPGTITVESMLRRRPMVVMGRVNALSAWIARRSLRVEWLSMPNLLAGAEIVPELLQGEATGDRIAAALAPLFRGEARERQIEALDRASRRLGEPGATRKAAAIVEEMLGTHPS